MAGNPNYDKVSLLLHGDGADGSTVFTDNSPSPKTITCYGNAKISTAQSKHGGASMYFDGTGDYLTIPHNAAFSIQAGNFTLEGWVYRAASGVSHYLLSKREDTPSSKGWEWRINATNKLQFFHTGGSSITSSGNVASGAWVHVAVVRNGTTVTHYIDGVASGSATFADGVESVTTSLKVATASDFSDFFNGHLDDLQITKGSAEYTGGFTPPARHPDGMGEVSGVIKDDTGANCARTVRIHNRATGAMIASTTSDGTTGAYLLAAPTLDEVQRIVLDDAGGTLYNDIIDRVIPA